MKMQRDSSPVSYINLLARWNRSLVFAFPEALKGHFSVQVLVYDRRVWISKEEDAYVLPQRYGFRAILVSNRVWVLTIWGWDRAWFAYWSENNLEHCGTCEIWHVLPTVWNLLGYRFFTILGWRRQKIWGDGPEIGYEKSHILVWGRARVSSSSIKIPTNVPPGV